MLGEAAGFELSFSFVAWALDGPVPDSLQYMMSRATALTTLFIESMEHACTSMVGFAWCQLDLNPAGSG